MHTPIIGTLGYILSPDGKQVLMVHRIARESDDHFGKYNGLGGKMHADEDVAACMRREIFEESGLVCLEMSLRGTVNWTGFGSSGEDWLGFIFLITRFSGETVGQNNEGTLAWHALDSVIGLPAWEGDRYFLPLVFDGDPRLFHGYMPYQDGFPVGWTWSRV
jgi:8-oxo-dGTP diphosphatase